MGELVDKFEYDRPEDKESSGNRALIFLGLGVAVIVIFYFGIYR